MRVNALIGSVVVVAMCLAPRAFSEDGTNPDYLEDIADSLGVPGVSDPTPEGFKALECISNYYGSELFKMSGGVVTLDGVEVYFADMNNIPVGSPGLGLSGEDEEVEFTALHGASQCQEVGYVDNTNTWVPELDCYIILPAEFNGWACSDVDENAAYWVGIMLHERAHGEFWNSVTQACIDAELEEIAAGVPCDELTGTGPVCQGQALKGKVLVCRVGYDGYISCLIQKQKEADPSMGEDPLGEAYADYSAFLCSCKKACAEPDPEKRDAMIAAANGFLTQAKAHWASFLMFKDQCDPQVELPSLPGLDTPFAGPSALPCDCMGPPPAELLDGASGGCDEQTGGTDGEGLEGSG